MLIKKVIISSTVSLVLVFGVATNEVSAQMEHGNYTIGSEKTTQFHLSRCCRGQKQ